METCTNSAINVRDLSDLLQAIKQKLIAKNLTLCFAESATAGRVSSCFSLVEDSGAFLKGGIICYDACVKEELLGVDPEMIKKYSAESEEVTEAITVGIHRLMKADISIGITGLLRPGGSETPEKPVGTIFVHALKGERKLFRARSVFTGSPDQIMMKSTFLVARLLHGALQDENIPAL